MVKPQGRRGEVAVELHTSFPERFAERRHVFLLMPGGERREAQVEDFWAHKGRMVLKLAGVDSISQAQELAGSEVQIPRAQRAALEPGSAYVADLVGCTLAAAVGDAGMTDLGLIERVEFGAGEAPLLAVRGADREYLLPLADEYLAGAGIDLAQRRVEMTLPEGMLELAIAAAPSRPGKAPRRRTRGRGR